MCCRFRLVGCAIWEISEYMPLNELGAAIARHPNRVEVAFCGFDLWCEVMTNDKLWFRPLKKGGVPATDEEAETELVFRVPVIGKGIVISFDPTLPPDGFRLAP